MLASSECRAQDLHLSNLELGKRETYYIRKGDSSMKLTIDTLIMHKGAKIIAAGKKEVVLTVGAAYIDSRSTLSGDDGRGNGTNFDLRINFKQLKSLYINTQGKNFREGNRSNIIGHGGNVTIHYLNTGIKPQTGTSSAPAYIAVSAEGGKGSVSPYTDMEIIRSQIRSGSAPGRPLGSLPNGTVYQGSDGNSGKVSLQGVEHL